MQDTDLLIARHPATLRLLVEEKLRAAIASGLFKPGQRLIERELCELTGVGRTSIREAIRQLEAEGLITVVPHRGPAVSVVTAAEAREIYAVRALLEGYAGREFARRRPPAEIDALARDVERFARAAEGNDRRSLIEAKTAFYATLMRGCGNAIAMQMLTTLHNRVTLLRLTSMSQPGRLRQSVAEIRTIAEAIASGDPAAAERACIVHIERAATVAIGVLEGPSDEKPRKVP
ncbi:GntR family transcriptional regulator [Methylobacterium nigriterrae]|uniref:GntR family transcriptional regulator n=1 Tax=Methylobacterium nigriterrae TaxID=3127512 RepID=UPI003013B1C1